MQKYLDAISDSHKRMEDVIEMIDFIIDLEIGGVPVTSITSDLVTDKDQLKECAINTEYLEGKLSRISDRLHLIIMGSE